MSAGSERGRFFNGGPWSGYWRGEVQREENSGRRSPHDMPLRELREMQRQADEIFFLRDHMRPESSGPLQTPRARSMPRGRPQRDVFAASPIMSRSVIAGRRIK